MTWHNNILYSARVRHLIFVFVIVVVVVIHMKVNVVRREIVCAQRTYTHARLYCRNTAQLIDSSNRGAFYIREIKRHLYKTQDVQHVYLIKTYTNLSSTRTRRLVGCPSKCVV